MVILVLFVVWKSFIKFYLKNLQLDSAEIINAAAKDGYTLDESGFERLSVLSTRSPSDNEERIGRQHPHTDVQAVEERVYAIGSRRSSRLIISSSSSNIGTELKNGLGIITPLEETGTSLIVYPKSKEHLHTVIRKLNDLGIYSYNESLPSVENLKILRQLANDLGGPLQPFRVNVNYRESLVFNDDALHCGPDSIDGGDGRVLSNARVHQYYPKETLGRGPLSTFPVEFYMHSVVANMFFAL